MRHILSYVIASISIAAMCSCSVSEPDGPTLNNDRAGHVVKIEAILADAAISKTVRKEDGRVYWKPADEINVFFGTQNVKFTSSNTEDVSTAAFTGSFTGVVGMSEGEESSNYMWGLYPYDDNAEYDGKSITTGLSYSQKGVAGTFADDSYITLAKSKNFSLAFYNVLSGFKFTLTREGIESVTFSGNNGEELAGTLKLAFDEKGKPIVQEIKDGSTEIILMPENGKFEVGKEYYVLFVPTTFSKGFSVKMEGDYMEGTFVYENSITFARNEFKRKVNVDSEVEFVETDNSLLVDLGLSVNWASHNVGATSPEEYGGYYAWGETKEKSYYDWDTYKWCYDYGKFSKYNTSSYEGPIDNKTVLDPEDDVAQVKWGGNWRMPTVAECEELIYNCDTEWTTLNGVKGRKFTSRINGNSIFLPAAGYRYDDKLSRTAGSDGYYWSSSLNTKDPYLARIMDFGSGGVATLGYNVERYYGRSVRPVSE